MSEEAMPAKRWLASLGIHGFGESEVQILASLATADPMLLIGPHGTAKSLLLTRLAEAIGLEFRHYNASLIAFDDLLGFPIPDGKGGLRYAETPATVWHAQAVFFDEISRCRPEVQNKLFPIIHEKKVQGLDLKSLQYRWAAMNPPASIDGEAEGETYLGSEPLDVALADRFAFIIETPRWQDFTEEEKRAVLTEHSTLVDEKTSLLTKNLIKAARAIFGSQSDDFQSSVSDYILTLEPILLRAGIVLSPRRLNMLHRNIRASVAANEALGSPLNDSECLLRTLAASIPDRAFGKACSPLKLQGSHKEAYAVNQLKKDNPLRRVMLEADSIARLSLLMNLKVEDKEFASQVVMDTLSEMSEGAREAAISVLANAPLLGSLTSAVASNLCEQYSRMLAAPSINETISSGSDRNHAWQRIVSAIAGLDPAKESTTLLSNLLADLWARKRVKSEEDVDRVVWNFEKTATALGAS